LLNPQEQKLLKTDAKSLEQYTKFYENEMKRTQYLWIGFRASEVVATPTVSPAKVNAKN
jgi:hypothetical protein